MRRLFLVSLAAAMFAGLTGVGTAASTARVMTAWTPTLAVVPQEMTEVSAFPDGTAFVFITGINQLFRSANFGRGWKRLAAPPTGGATPVVRMADPLLGYDAANGSLFRTTDGARTWRRLKVPSVKGVLGIDALGLADDGRTIVLGSSIYPFGGGFANAVTIFTTHDAGGTWATTTLPFRGLVGDIRMLDGQTGLIRVQEDDASGNSVRDRVYLTRDGVASLTQILNFPDGGLTDRLCTAMAMADAQRIVVGRNDGGILVSRDGGATFAAGPILSPPAPIERTAFWVQGIGFATAKRGFASVKGGGTYRTDDGGLTWVPEPSPDRVWGLGQGDIAVADAEHAIIGGPTFVSTRLLLPAP